MALIAVTGAIGAGKSEFTGRLSALLEAESLDTDLCARELLTANAEVGVEVERAFGPEIFSGGQIDRPKLREAIFGDEGKRRALENIVHPRIRQRWTQWAAERRDRIALVEIPLLYETGAEVLFDYSIVVGCTRGTQIQRLITSRRLSRATAQHMVDSQWDVDEKIKRGDCVIWNDGSRPALETQINLCARRIEMLFGPHNHHD